MSFSIKVEGLTKVYQIGTEDHAAYPTLRDEIAAFFSRLFRFQKAKPLKKASVLATNNVSFEIGRGEIIGIVGRNGAGKSTLLKMLSRITEPTEGCIQIRGRLASLLEVGTGFHPELTGRENIFLNGAILGMSRSEIRSKFDQIVSYSGVEKFIDTPVKRYSSGMYVRLAFAVAAHLDPDILVVDEVLSVGDAAFQRKCTDTMKSVASQRRTVLFVTHNLQLVRSLCTRAILIEDGKIALDGPTDQVLNHYVKSLQQSNRIDSAAESNRRARSDGRVQFTSIQAIDNKNSPRWFYRAGEKMSLEFRYAVKQDVPSLGCYISFRTALSGDVVTTALGTLSDGPLKAGTEGAARLSVQNLTLRPGDYLLYFALGEKEGGRWNDVVDENVNLPLLSVTSEEGNPLRDLGYFSLPASFETVTETAFASAG